VEATFTKNRRELDHVVKILRAASKGAKKTQLYHRCNLTKPTFGKYVAALAELDLLEVKTASETYYKTTDKGLDLLHTYHKLRWLLWGGTFDFMLVGLLGRLKMDRQEREKYNVYIT
jgi:predicted transcriptional regulator